MLSLKDAPNIILHDSTGTWQQCGTPTIMVHSTSSQRFIVRQFQSFMNTISFSIDSTEDYNYTWNNSKDMMLECQWSLLLYEGDLVLKGKNVKLLLK